MICCIKGTFIVKYSGIIFDLDGTLLDTIEDLANSMNCVLQKQGFPQHTTEEYKTFVGNGMEKLVERALPSERRDKKIVALCLAQLHKEYGCRWDERTKPYQGVNELLDKLAVLGVKMSILSNKPDLFTKQMVDKFFGLKRFQLVFGAREDVAKKPDPVAALEIVKLSKIAAEKYLYLGDSGVDMKTANAAGMYAVGATWGFRKADELMENGGKILIDSPVEIIKLI
ncbi:MAG: phosphoglycolate phosphatase [Pelosinus sp.]|jgi:phosphoglycolate phosphatase|nr:phosphoglycolate phosphatase [Pelosinus sp.]